MNQLFSRVTMLFVLALGLIALTLIGCTAPQVEVEETPMPVTAATPETAEISDVTPTRPPPQSTIAATIIPTATSTPSPTAAPPTATIAPTTTVTPTPELPQASATGHSATAPATSPTSPTAAGLTVAYIQDGEIRVWDEATGQSKTIFSEDGLHTVMMSDDGQVIAFMRHWVDECNQSALWAVGPDGENPRELLSSTALLQQLGVADSGETPQCAFPAYGVFQIEWLPHTHRLLYSLYAGDEHVSPTGVYLMDADTSTVMELAPAENSLHFVPSPDGRQIALLSTTALGFIHADGSNWRQEVLTYPATGVPIPNLPHGVWSQDARQFLLVGPMESGDLFVLNYTIWRVPLDGSAAEPLAIITDSTGRSVTFSPDGARAAFRSPASVDWESWLITPLAAGVGPLAVPYVIDTSFYDNLHWSPAGAAFVFSDTLSETLLQLCPDATQDSDVCGDPLHLGESVGTLRWIDGNRFVFLTRDPDTFEPGILFQGQLDGTTIPIATGVSSFAIASEACIDNSEFVLDVTVPDGTHFAPGTSFTKTWRIRNNGTCTWGDSYSLTFVSGDPMNGPEHMPLGETVLPGGEIDLSIDLIAPQAAGTYRGQWQLTAADGTPFGAKPYVEIVVP